jgi:hypothetical protein
MKLEFSWQIFQKCSKIKIPENPFSGSRVVPCGRVTEGHAAKGGFSEFCGRASKLLFRRHLKITRNNSAPLARATKTWITNFKG